jgi:selenocysteine lyase/cysteine desulfurase
LDFKLRNKMSAGMYLVANRSLFREPDGFWKRLSASYSKRNAIIHRGENATEDEATQALAVARRIVQIMGEV